MMEKVSLNAEKSRALYMKHPQRFGAKECYANIYRAVTENFSKVMSGAWKVAYGYYTVGEIAPSLLARHCFLLDENNEVIDPTVFTHKPINLRHDYYVAYVFPSGQAYLDALEQENFYPALGKYLTPYMAQAQEWADKQGYCLVG